MVKYCMQDSDPMTEKILAIQLRGGPPWGFRLKGGRGGGLYISTVNSKGRQQGLKEGDRLLSIDGRSAAEMTHAEAQAALKESSGTVELHVQRRISTATSGMNGENGVKNCDLSPTSSCEDSIVHSHSWSTDSTSTGSTIVHVSPNSSEEQSSGTERVWSPSGIRKKTNLKLDCGLQGETVERNKETRLVQSCTTTTSTTTATKVESHQNQVREEEESSPVWQPFGALYEGPQFRPVKLDVKTTRTPTPQPEESKRTATPDNSTTMVSAAKESTTSEEKSSTTTGTTTTSPTFVKSGWGSHLPPSQSPTITLLQKAREGQLPKGAIYLDDKPDSTPLPKNAVLIDQKVTVEGDKVHTDSLYAVPTTLSTETTTHTIKTPEKYDGIGPTEYGIPVGLRTGIKEEYASDWYKTMYKSLHRPKFPNEPSHAVHFGGYMSEPEFDRKDAYYLQKYATTEHRRKPFEKSVTYSTETNVDKTKKSVGVESSVVKHEPQKYKVEPRSIADYEPGRSSLAEKEFEKFWSDFWDSMDDLHEHLGDVSPRPRHHQLGLNRRWANVLLSDGYESDSTLIRKTGRVPHVDPEQQKAWYKEIQKGGEIPLIGLRKSAPEKPSEPRSGKSQPATRAYGVEPPYLNHKHVPDSSPCRLTPARIFRTSNELKTPPNPIQKSIRPPPSPPKRLSSKQKSSVPWSVMSKNHNFEQMMKIGTHFSSPSSFERWNGRERKFQCRAHSFEDIDRFPHPAFLLDRDPNDRHHSVTELSNSPTCCLHWMNNNCDTHQCPVYGDNRLTYHKLPLDVNRTSVSFSRHFHDAVHPISHKSIPSTEQRSSAIFDIGRSSSHTNAFCKEVKIGRERRDDRNRNTSFEETGTKVGFLSSNVEGNSSLPKSIESNCSTSGQRLIRCKSHHDSTEIDVGKLSQDKTNFSDLSKIVNCESIKHERDRSLLHDLVSVLERNAANINEKYKKEVGVTECPVSASSCHKSLVCPNYVLSESREISANLNKSKPLHQVPESKRNLEEFSLDFKRSKAFPSNSSTRYLVTNSLNNSRLLLDQNTNTKDVYRLNNRTEENMSANSSFQNELSKSIKPMHFGQPSSAFHRHSSKIDDLPGFNNIKPDEFFKITNKSQHFNDLEIFLADSSYSLNKNSSEYRDNCHAKNEICPTTKYPNIPKNDNQIVSLEDNINLLCPPKPIGCRLKNFNKLELPDSRVEKALPRMITILPSVIRVSELRVANLETKLACSEPLYSVKQYCKLDLNPLKLYLKLYGQRNFENLDGCPFEHKFSEMSITSSQKISIVSDKCLDKCLNGVVPSKNNRVCIRTNNITSSLMPCHHNSLGKSNSNKISSNLMPCFDNSVVRSNSSDEVYDPCKQLSTKISQMPSSNLDKYMVKNRKNLFTDRNNAILYHHYISTMVHSVAKSRKFLHLVNFYSNLDSLGKFNKDSNRNFHVIKIKEFELFWHRSHGQYQKWNREHDTCLKVKRSSVEDLKKLFQDIDKNTVENTTHKISFRYTRFWYNVSVSNLVEKYSGMQSTQENIEVRMKSKTCCGGTVKNALSALNLHSSSENIVPVNFRSGALNRQVEKHVNFVECISSHPINNVASSFPTSISSSCSDLRPRVSHGVRSKVRYFEDISQVERSKKGASACHHSTVSTNVGKFSHSRNLSWSDLRAIGNGLASENSKSIFSPQYLPEKAMSCLDLTYFSECSQSSFEPSLANSDYGWASSTASCISQESADKCNDLPSRFIETGTVSRLKNQLEKFVMLRSKSVPQNIAAVGSDLYTKGAELIPCKFPLLAPSGSVQNLKKIFEPDDSSNQSIKKKDFSNRRSENFYLSKAEVSVKAGPKENCSCCRKQNTEGFEKSNGIHKNLMEQYMKNRMQSLISKFELSSLLSATRNVSSGYGTSFCSLDASKLCDSSTNKNSASKTSTVAEWPTNRRGIVPSFTMLRNSPQLQVKLQELYSDANRQVENPFHSRKWMDPSFPKVQNSFPKPYVKKVDNACSYQKKTPASPHQYQETEVNIHYRSPIRHLEKEYIEEEELKRRQEDAMRKFYEEEKKKKHQQELAEIEMRRHSDYFTPSQKSPIPLNRYENPFEMSYGNRLAPPGMHRGPLPKTMARALYPFTAQTNRELSLNKGDIVYIARLIDRNWYEGEHHGLMGIFPVSYVEIIPCERANMQPRKATEGEAMVKYNFRAQSPIELSLFKGEKVVLTRRMDRNWYEGRLGTKKGIFPVSYVNVLQEPGEFNSGSRAISPKPPASPVYSPIVNGSPPKVEGPTFNTGQYRPLQNKPPLNLDTKSALTQSLHIDTYNEPIPYRSLYSYKPQNDDELELQEGDTVYVMEKCDDGWYVGTSLRSGLFGTFPGNYVERI